MKTRICELIGIEYPIFQGGMAWVADAYLAAAVSNAGGLGLIAAMNSNGEQLRAEIKKAKELTDKPFGVNIMLMSPFAAEAAKVVIEEKIPVVTTGAGSPLNFMEAWLAAGIKIVPVVPSVAIAKRVAAAGAHAVVAEGGESGGHIGELNTMTLVPQICDAVSIPVIAAGGIADGRGVAAAFMLGAEGVQLGTRFLVAKECTIHQNYKNKVLNARDIDTITTGKRLGHPVRQLKNEFSRALAAREYDSTITNEEFEALGVGSLRRAAREGDIKTGTFMAGQCAGLVKKEQTCKEMIEELFAEAEVLLNGAGKWVR
ncbi:MAG: 2-nitropropane dioxygenase [Clostridiales bacterium GWF2_36_10]|nr:MAG: 2-nitropropane dioxygenase [Clostridiales bacterium GWF2_36_10]HAN21079.1 enoyl-[acyl-carrier-protein] reductase FabK [Clostridiales bacterium]